MASAGSVALFVYFITSLLHYASPAERQACKMTWPRPRPRNKWGEAARLVHRILLLAIQLRTLVCADFSQSRYSQLELIP